MNPDASDHPDDELTCSFAHLTPQEAWRLTRAFEDAGLAFGVTSSQEPPANEHEGDSPPTFFTITLAAEAEEAAQRIAAKVFGF